MSGPAGASSYESVRGGATRRVASRCSPGGTGERVLSLGRKCARSWTEVSAALGPLVGFRFCLVTTSEAGGSRHKTRARFVVDGGRAILRAPARSELAARVWRSSHVTVAPCGPSGRPLGPPVAVKARVIPEAEEPAAEALLRAGAGPLERLSLRLGQRRGVGPLYVEIAPHEEGS